MGDLIDRQAAIDELGYCQTYLFDSRDKDTKISLEDAEYAIEQLPSAQPEQQWIPCSKRLPDKDGRYWVWAENFVVPDHADEPETYQGSTEASFLNGRWWGDVGKVYAWMPLPKPYKPKENQDKE